MARYVVATRRDLRDRADIPSALDAVRADPRVEVVSESDPHMIIIEASPAEAAHLEAKLATTHFVEPEIRRNPQ